MAPRRYYSPFLPPSPTADDTERARPAWQSTASLVAANAALLKPNQLRRLLEFKLVQKAARVGRSRQNAALHRNRELLLVNWKDELQRAETTQPLDPDAIARCQGAVARNEDKVFWRLPYLQFFLA